MYYIVETGLTRRLVEAETPEDAYQEFVRDRLMRSFLGDAEGAVLTRPATDEEIVEFSGARRRKPTFDDQIVLELDDIRAGYGDETEHA